MACRGAEPSFWAVITTGADDETGTVRNLTSPTVCPVGTSTRWMLNCAGLSPDTCTGMYPDRAPSTVVAPQRSTHGAGAVSSTRSTTSWPPVALPADAPFAASFVICCPSNDSDLTAGSTALAVGSIAARVSARGVGAVLGAAVGAALGSAVGAVLGAAVGLEVGGEADAAADGPLVMVQHALRPSSETCLAPKLANTC